MLKPLPEEFPALLSPKGSSEEAQGIGHAHSGGRKNHPLGEPDRNAHHAQAAPRSGFPPRWSPAPVTSAWFPSVLTPHSRSACCPAVLLSCCPQLVQGRLHWGPEAAGAGASTRSLGSQVIRVGLLLALPLRCRVGEWERFPQPMWQVPWGCSGEAGEGRPGGNARARSQS